MGKFRALYSPTLISWSSTCWSDRDFPFSMLTPYPILKILVPKGRGVPDGIPCQGPSCPQFDNLHPCNWANFVTQALATWHTAVISLCQFCMLSCMLGPWTTEEIKTQCRPISIQFTDRYARPTFPSIPQKQVFTPCVRTFLPVVFPLLACIFRVAYSNWT